MIPVDHPKNIERIISVLKSNELTFKKNVKGKTRQINSGDPHNKQAGHEPYSFVTVPESLLDTHWQYGSSENQNQVFVKYEIVIISKSQKELLEIIKNYQTVLSEDSTFADPASKTDDTISVDPIFVKSVISDVQRESRKGMTGRGGLIEVCTITLTAQIGSGTVLSIGDMEIPILGMTGNDGKNYSEDTPNGTRILTENNPNGSLFVEIELTSAINSKIKEIFNADDKIPLTVKQGNMTDSITAYPVSIEWVVQYDQLNRRVLHFELT